MAAWRASLGACGVALAMAAAPAQASPIAELEALLRARATDGDAVAARDGIEPAVTVLRDGLPWNYAVLERDRNIRPAAVDPHAPMPGAAAPEAGSDLSGSIGCIVGGTVGTALASMGGGLNTINLIGGGIVSAINPLTFYVSLVGVVFISFCQLGQAVTPLYLHLMAPTPPPEPLIGPPQAVPPLDNLPDFRRTPPVESRPGVPMVRAADRTGRWVPATTAPDRRDCVQDRRSIRLAMSAITHGAAIPPRCSGSLI